MKWHELGEEACPIARSLSLLGDRWTLLIIRNAFMRTRRFNDFQQQLGITRHLLTERLNRLVEHGVLEKVPYQQAPLRHEYRLTERGLALYPILMALVAWGNQWLNPDAHPPLHYLHQTCGHAVQPTMSCPECGEELHARNTQLQLTR